MKRTAGGGGGFAVRGARCGMTRQRGSRHGAWMFTSVAATGGRVKSSVYAFGNFGGWRDSRMPLVASLSANVGGAMAPRQSLSELKRRALSTALQLD